MKRWIPLALAGVALACGLAAGAGSAPVRHARPAGAPSARDWSMVVTRQADGAFLLGNPGAPIKLTEYMSFTCSHCATFSAEGMPALKANYIRPGRVSIEFRHALRDGFDFVSALLARCAGPAAYPAVAETIFAQQDSWLPRAASAPPFPPASGGPTPAQLNSVAHAAGLDAIAASRGVPAARQLACLGNAAEKRTISAMAQDAWETKHIPGTPAFLLNGRLLDQTSGWDKLEPQLKAALDGQ